VRGQSRRLRRCYTNERATNPKLRGELTVAWTVTRRGRVARPRVMKRTLRSSRLEACVVRAVARMQFPRPTDGRATVVYPFVFTPD